MQVKKLIQNELKLVKFTNQDSEMMQEGGEEAQDHMWEKKLWKRCKWTYKPVTLWATHSALWFRPKTNQFSVSIKKLHI